MADRIVEWLYVFANSDKSQALLLLAVFIASAIWFAGPTIASTIDASGTFAPIIDPLRDLVTRRYRTIACGICTTGLLATVRLVRKERKRLLHL